MNTTAYLIVRLAIGASFFGHGLVRLPKLTAFSNWMVAGFEKSWIPAGIVMPFSYVLPFAEFITGMLLLLGLFTRQASIAGSILMLLLILGTTLIEHWDALPSQMIHILFLIILLQFLENNSYSMDSLLNK